MLVHESTKQFIEKPNDYFLKVTFKDKTCIFSAEKKNLVTRIKAFLSGYFNNYFGHYKLDNVCNYAEWLKPVPENTPLKQALNTVIGKYNGALHTRNPRSRWYIVPFDTIKVTLQPDVVLTRDKIAELANDVFKDGYFTRWPKFNPETNSYDLPDTDIKNMLVSEIDKRMQDGLEAHPELYMNQWIRLRGGTHEYRTPEDNVRDFFLHHVFTIVET